MVFMCCLSYYLGCGTLFAYTICHEEYEKYKKINKYKYSIEVIIKEILHTLKI